MATINLGAIKFNWRGAYNNSTAYAVDDVVSSGGSSYICILASTGNAVSNGTYWQVLAEGGDVATTLTTQGDILYRDGSGLQRLAIGTANQELRVNSGATALEYHTPSGGGILQVKSTTKTDTQSFSDSTTRADITGLNVTLTPSSASNKILVRFMVSHWGNDSHCQIERSIGGGSYSIISPPTGTLGNRTPTHSGGSHRVVNDSNTATMEVLDAPNTSSAITYKMTFNNGPGTGTSGYVNRVSDDSDAPNTERLISTITAMEVAAGAL